MSLNNQPHAEHGGAFFEAIGVDFRHLDRRGVVVNADVLDAWYDPSPRVVEAIRKHLPWLIKTSPPTQGEGLVREISRARGISAEAILIGAGTSSLIYEALPVLIKRGGTALVLDPSYGEYEHLFETVLALRLERHLLEPRHGFQPDLDKLTRQASTADLVVLVNPNSPTGHFLAREHVRAVLDAMRQDAILWVDETYVDFADPDQSVERLAVEDRRLIVAKSMSKFYALSGLRLGYLVAHPDTVRRVRPWSPPWAVGLVAQVAAVEALRDSAYYRARARETTALRGNLALALSEIDGLRVFPSSTGFLLIELATGGAAELVRHAAEQGVFLRNCDSMSDRFTGSLIRTAVKDATANQRIVAAIGSAIRR